MKKNRPSQKQQKSDQKSRPPLFGASSQNNALNATPSHEVCKFDFGGDFQQKVCKFDFGGGKTSI